MPDAERLLLLAMAHALAGAMENREAANAISQLAERVEKGGRKTTPVPLPLGTPEMYAGECSQLATRIRTRLDANTGVNRANAIPLSLGFIRELLSCLDAAALLLAPSPAQGL